MTPEITNKMKALSNPRLRDRIWSKIIKGSEGECWQWSGNIDELGYGKISNTGTTQLAHRLVLMLKTGESPSSNILALHSCDNPGCCNPSHLRWGTSSDNMADASLRGRLRNSKKTHCHKGHEFTEENTIIRGLGLFGKPKRACKTCYREQQRRYDRKRDGAKNPKTKRGRLSRDEIIAIRSANGSQRSIAASFNISPRTVGLIRRLERHRHV